ncbi:MAG: epoxyqueuosine reductase [Anaerolineae bacterium]|nr:epoxyqueuosine reductase [Anaerolineae bacterium]
MALDAQRWLCMTIEAYCAGPDNTLQDAANEPAWAAPLVGFARGDDPIFERFKEAVGPFHWTPWEIFSQTHPDSGATPAELTIISWVLPQTLATKCDSRQQTTWPPERWARSRIYGEEFNNKLRRHVVAVLEARGYTALAPFLSPHFATQPSERFLIASTWSERHVAHASGLGTFGLCDGLITPVGKAMRVGSVVARIGIPPTPRPYRHHQAYCLFYAKGTCGECMRRCPVGAITEKGHDKAICRQHLNRTREYVESTYKFKGYGCGLCQTGVPCESGIPLELIPDVADV